MLANGRALVKQGAISPCDKDATLLRIVQQIQICQRDAYRRLQADAEANFDTHGGELFLELGNEMAEGVDLSAAALAALGIDSGTAAQAGPKRS